MVSHFVDDEAKEGSGITVFGRDIMSIPCFRESALVAIPTGVTAMLVSFLLTSRPRISSHIGFGTFMVVLYSYWSVCRYKFSKVKLEIEEVQELLKQNRGGEIVAVDSFYSEQ